MTKRIANLAGWTERMIPGFHVGSLLLHDQAEAISHIAGLGFRCVAIRPRPGSLSAAESSFGLQIVRLAEAVRQAGVGVVIDADAHFMPDPHHRRGPSLVASSDTVAAAAERWIEQWVDVASELGADLVTFASGPAEPPDAMGVTDEQALERIAVALNRLAPRAASKQVSLAIRPVSGDAIATVAHFERLGQWLEDPDQILLAADIGEMLLGHELPLSDRLERNLDALACVYLCDHRAGAIGDQRIGHGDVALSRITTTLFDRGYQGRVIVRVDGHADHGFTLAEESIELFAGLGR